ncbi:hypothetical protein [Fusobacterium sp.]|uniref:hypothetical protein n=1 Tax=Fusobacterium sp. TaxID=68766 RepID=UPI002904DF86|nr:hypothetical protein [Fusobacterium sp.]MDU1909710.1 hypothetical protein [Fusobacterium sp.]
MTAKYNREQIALDLLLCTTNLEVCKKNNISEATLYRLKKDEAFQQLVIEQKEKMFKETMKKAQAYSLEAIEVLRSIAQDKEAPQSSRVSASSKIIELGQCMYDQEKITKKLEDIERWLNESKKT